MIGNITVNGKNSQEFNVFLTDAGIYGMPEKDTKTIQIDGRNGDLIIDNGRYKNKEAQFPCVIVDDFERHFTEFIEYLLNQAGYSRIETSFKPDEYILGRYVGEVDPTSAVNAKEGKFVIKFDRKPQRYIKDGENPIVFTSSSSIFNHYSGVALPLVRVYGTGTVTIGSVTITINSVNEYVDIDCQLQDAFKGATNCNGNITLNSNEFFKLNPGTNGITLGNGITRVIITPRWWKL